MPLLFAYGTLQQGSVQLSTFGRRLSGQKDELIGFEPSLVKIEDPEVAATLGKTHHANVRFNGNRESRVAGMAFEVTEAELVNVDAYEAPFMYKRIAAELASGRQTWVYVDARSAQISPEIDTFTVREARLVADPRALMRIQIAALFEHDANGKLTHVNEPMGARAPRFFLGRTNRGNEWRFRDDVSADVARELEAICLREPEGDELLAPPYGVAAYERVLARIAPVQHVEAGPAYRFPPDVGGASGTVVVTSRNIDVLRPHLTAWLDDVKMRQPFVAVVRDGHAVSVCCSVRITPAAHEAGVETHPDFRGHGFAGQVVSAWATAVRGVGAIPLYSTSWQNVASQAVAQKLGLVRYGTDLHLT